MIIYPGEWIKEPGEDGKGFFSAWFDRGDEVDVEIPVETDGIPSEDVIPDKEQDFSITLTATEDFEIFRDEKEFLEKSGKEKFYHGMLDAWGLYPDSAKEKTPAAYVYGKVTEIKNPVKCGYGEKDTVFTVKCYAYEFDAVIPAGTACTDGLKEDCVISGIFRVSGVPSGN